VGVRKGESLGGVDNKKPSGIRHPETGTIALDSRLAREECNGTGSLGVCYWQTEKPTLSWGKGGLRRTTKKKGKPGAKTTTTLGYVRKELTLGQSPTGAKDAKTNQPNRRRVGEAK